MNSCFLDFFWIKYYNYEHADDFSPISVILKQQKDPPKAWKRVYDFCGMLEYSSVNAAFRPFFLILTLC